MQKDWTPKTRRYQPVTQLLAAVVLAFAGWLAHGEFAVLCYVGAAVCAGAAAFDLWKGR